MELNSSGFRHFWRRIAGYLRRVPLFGALIDCRGRDHKEALWEVGINIAFSTVPIWFGALIIMAWDTTSRPFFNILISNVRSGELYIYAAGLLAPIFYFISREGANIQALPRRRVFFFTSLAILLLSVGLFAAQRAGVAFGRHVNDDFIFNLSWQIYLVTIAVVYVAHVYRNYVEGGAPHIMQREQDDFLRRYDESKGDDQ